MIKEGKLTFDAEGREGGRYHSRKLHVPSDNSGLTIGRGYDCKLKWQDTIFNDLLRCGLGVQISKLLSMSHGLKGETAKKFIGEHSLEKFEITIEQQERLFNITYKALKKDVRRICNKKDCKKAYGYVDWFDLDQRIKEILVDLRFRGDYTPRSRKLIQKHVADNNFIEFREAMIFKGNWARVPLDRFNRRVDFLNKA